MVDSTRLLSEAARESVQEIVEPYLDYRADLVTTFTKVLQVLHAEPNERAELRVIENLVVDFAAQVSSTLKEL